MKNVIISACLIGCNTRYNGESSLIPEFEELKEKYNLIPVCPEQLGGLPTPRIPSEIRGDKVIGNLTIKDVTKPVELEYDFGGTSTDPKGKEHIGFSLEGKIKRSDFNFAPNNPTAMLGDEIKISVDIEAIK